MIIGYLIVYYFMKFVLLGLRQKDFRTVLYRNRKTIFHRVQSIAAEEKSISLLKNSYFFFCFSKKLIAAEEQSNVLLKN